MMFDDIFICPEWRAVSHFYGNRKAEHSKVPLINHIIEGIKILTHINASFEAMAAYCLHPLFQEDNDLKTIGMKFVSMHGYRQSIFLAMEYRGIANAYLSRHVIPADGIHISAFKEVNDMLIADKIQNRKEFELYHRETHRNSARLDMYFKEWLIALGVSENKYQKITEILMV